MRYNFIGSFFSAFFLLISVGCNEPFSPKGPFEQRLVAYSVLSTLSDSQYVRLSANYNPPGFDPYADTFDRSDTTAKVTVSSAGSIVSFHDTIVTPTDQSRFAALHVFASHSFRPIPGTAYTLTAISSRYGTITATSTMPGKGYLYIQDQSKLYNPNSFPNSTIDVDATLGLGTKGIIVRFLIESGLSNDPTFVALTEVPLTFEQNASGTWVPTFGKPMRAASTSVRVSFAVKYYLQTLDDNIARYGSQVFCHRAKFLLIQLDEGLYDYYNLANGFRDPYSIRTDLPDYTNIQNGLGAFGSFTVDTLTIDFLRPLQ
jgi:hypothetical protein